MTRRTYMVPALLALVTGLSTFAGSAIGQIHVSTRGVDPMHCELCPIFPNRALDCEYGVCHYADVMKYHDHVSLAAKPQDDAHIAGCGDASWYDEHSTWVDIDACAPPVADDSTTVPGDILDANEYDFQYDYDLVDADESEAQVATTEGTEQDDRHAADEDPYAWDGEAAYNDYDYDYEDWYYEEYQQYEHETAASEQHADDATPLSDDAVAETTSSDDVATDHDYYDEDWYYQEYAEYEHEVAAQSQPTDVATPADEEVAETTADDVAGEYDYYDEDWYHYEYEQYEAKHATEDQAAAAPATDDVATDDVAGEYDFYDEDWYLHEYEQYEAKHATEDQAAVAPATEDVARETETEDVHDVDDYYYGDDDYGYDYAEQYYGSYAAEEDVTVDPQQVLAAVAKAFQKVSHAWVTLPAQHVLDDLQCRWDCWMCESGVEEAWYIMVEQLEDEETYPVSTPVCHPLDPMDDHCGYECELWYDYED